MTQHVSHRTSDEYHRLHLELERAQAKGERLEAALREIAEFYPHIHAGRIAHAALEGK